MSRLTKGIIILIAGYLLVLLPRTDLCARDPVSQYINRMTLSQKVGQLIFLGFQGQSLSPQDISHIRKINPGGIIFYGRNFQQAADIAPLVSQINSLSLNREIPMFYAVDQEGGIVHRMAGEFYRPPSASAIGAANSEHLARMVGASAGLALKGLGININFTPVLDLPGDILTSPMTLRSFGDNPQEVAKLGVAYIHGLQDSGLLATAKHFPGIGRAREDSHFKLPHVVWQTLSDQQHDLFPFREAIREGVDLVMVGHVIAEPGDGQNPVSLSAYWMKEVLRKEMRFRGLVIVDNLEMKAIESLASIPEAAVKSFLAGADIITISHERKNQKAVFEALVKAVRRGDISMRRLDESLRRVLEAKRRIRATETTADTLPRIKEISQLVAENSIVAMQKKDLPPLHLQRGDAILYAGYSLAFFQALKDVFAQVEILNTPLSEYQKMKPGIPFPTFLKKFKAVVIDASYSEPREIISGCEELDREYVVLSHPLNIQKTLEEMQPRRAVVIFENSPAHLQAALKIIRGLQVSRGRLPYRFPMPENYTYPLKDR